jgi:hypothetical protein
MVHLVLVTFIFLGAIAPLTEQQKLDLAASARYQGSFVGDPGLFALLENAAAWTEGQPDIPVWTPDYQNIYDDASTWVGRLCRIEGTLETQWQLPPLGPRWQEAGALVLRTEQGLPVIVFLTDPPELTPTGQQARGHVLIAERGAQVRLIGRFYKLLKLERQDGDQRSYISFVGRRIDRLTIPAGQSDGPAVPLVAVILVALVLVMLGGYMLLRISTSRQRRLSPAEALAAYRQRRGAVDSDDPASGTPALPEDPAAALDHLTRNTDPRERSS